MTPNTLAWDSTHEYARTTALVPKDARLLVCTQPSHQARAKALFAAQGFEVELLDATEDFSLYSEVRERLAYVHHRLKGWL